MHKPDTIPTIDATTATPTPNATAEHEDTVAVFSHGGVINVVLHEILGTTRVLSFPIDYVSITRLLFSRSGQASVVTVNGTEHVWDLLPRNRRDRRTVVDKSRDS